MEYTYTARVSRMLIEQPGHTEYILQVKPMNGVDGMHQDRQNGVVAKLPQFDFKVKEGLFDNPPKTAEIRFSLEEVLSGRNMSSTKGFARYIPFDVLPFRIYSETRRDSPICYAVCDFGEIKGDFGVLGTEIPDDFPITSFPQTDAYFWVKIKSSTYDRLSKMEGKGSLHVKI